MARLFLFSLLVLAVAVSAALSCRVNLVGYKEPNCLASSFVARYSSEVADGACWRPDPQDNESVKVSCDARSISYYGNSTTCNDETGDPWRITEADCAQTAIVNGTSVHIFLTFGSASSLTSWLSVLAPFLSL